MSDYSELERRAQAAIDAIGTLSRARQEREFNDVCTPQVVKALIAENKRLLKLLERTVDQHVPLTELEGAPGWSRVVELVEVVAERDQLRAEVAGLKTGYEAYERVNAELKAECEALRKDAERYRWLRDSDYAGKILRDMGAKYRADSDQRIDAAMGKGDRP